MKKVQSVFRKFISLKWYYQLAIALVSAVTVVLLIKFLIWFVPIIGAILALLLVFTEGEIFSTMWESYKQRKQAPTNPLFVTVYHRLTECCVLQIYLFLLCSSCKELSFLTSIKDYTSFISKKKSVMNYFGSSKPG